MVAPVGIIHAGSGMLRLRSSFALAPAYAAVEGTATAAPPITIRHVMEVASIVGALPVGLDPRSVRDVLAGLLPAGVQIERGYGTAAPGYGSMLARMNPRGAVAHAGLWDGYRSK